MKFCESGLETFHNRFWRCEKRDNNGCRCTNFAVGHAKGHQREDGKIFSAEGFLSSYYSEKQKFLDTVTSTHQALFRYHAHNSERYPGSDRPGDKEARIAGELHMLNTLSKISDFWMLKALPSQQNSSPEVVAYHHQTCFCCLNSLPEHTLRCGHIICQNCLENFSKHSSCGNFFCMSTCPLCKKADPWEPEWKTKVKPPTAGLRILSLDGYVYFLSQWT
jgi:hypothetical protein